MAYIPETMTYEGANRLARTIDTYWFRQGRHEFKTRVVRQDFANPDMRPIYAVRSNITFDEHGYPVAKKEPRLLLDSYPE